VTRGLSRFRMKDSGNQIAGDKITSGTGSV
jgi:hypothetical protein